MIISYTHTHTKVVSVFFEQLGTFVGTKVHIYSSAGLKTLSNILSLQVVAVYFLAWFWVAVFVFWSYESFLVIVVDLKEWVTFTSLVFLCF